MLQLLADEGTTLSAIVADIPQYVIVKDKLDRPDARSIRCTRHFDRHFPTRVSIRRTACGLSWPDRWVHVRPSGTEPIVRVIAEAPTRSAAEELVSALSAAARRAGRGLTL